MDFTFHWFGLQRKLISPSPSLSLFFKKKNNKATCWQVSRLVEVGWHLAPRLPAPARGSAVGPRRREGCDSVPRADTCTHQGCHLPQRKIKVLATTRQPRGKRQVNRSMRLRAHAACRTTGVINKPTCGQWQQGGEVSE